MRQQCVNGIDGAQIELFKENYYWKIQDVYAIRKTVE